MLKGVNIDELVQRVWRYKLILILGTIFIPGLTPINFLLPLAMMLFS